MDTLNRYSLWGKGNPWRQDPTIANAMVAWLILILLGSLAIVACLFVAIWVIFKFVFVVITKGIKLIYDQFRKL